MPTFNEDVIVAGQVRVQSKGDGAVLLTLASERGWVFRQRGTGAPTALELTAATASNNNKDFLINTDGQVGIGTVTPASKLHVFGGPIHVSNDGDGASLLVLDSERGWVFRQRGSGASTALELTGISASNNNKHFIINTDGRVGIGTTAPTHKLHVGGSVKVEGSIEVADDVVLAGADCAEEFDIDPASDVEPGTVMVIGPDQLLQHSSRPYDTRVAGIISGAGDRRPGVVLGRRHGPTSGPRVPLALSGTVHCNVDASTSPIETGDLLTTSDREGRAMRAIDSTRAFGAIVGKALGGLDSGVGTIPVLVTLH